MSTDPLPPPPPPVDPPQIDPAITFTLLDPELPLALFPVRLEARFLPENQPTEIVVRVFPDDIHVDAHELELAVAEIELAGVYWETIWRGGCGRRGRGPRMACRRARRESGDLRRSEEPAGGRAADKTDSGWPALEAAARAAGAQTSRGVVARQSQADARPLVRFRRSR